MTYTFTNTKIISTLGPATSSYEMIKLLAQAGVNVFRLNFSHGTLAGHRRNVRFIRRAEKELKTKLGILCDLQGPKLRVATFEKGSVALKAGQTFTVDLQNKAGDETRVCLPHPEVFQAMKKNMIILLNDGAIGLRIDRFTDSSAQATVLNDGVLSDHKGFNVPNVMLPIRSLTDKDIEDLQEILKMDINWIGLSFVQHPDDVRHAREIIGDKAAIMVKLEKPTALDYLEEIVNLSDGVMVARGDLGVECPLEQVPSLQKKIVSVCRKKGKPVVIATQMLETMIQNPLPTRAEVSDVATAVYDGADCVMLSGETAVGRYPVQAVSMMNRIILQTEQDPFYRLHLETDKKEENKSVADSISISVDPILKTLPKPALVVTFSMSGSTIFRIAQQRPRVPILAFVGNEKIAHKVTLLWGTVPVVCKTPKTMMEIIKQAQKQAKKMGLATAKDQLVITTGYPFVGAGNTNMVHVYTMQEDV